MNALHRGALPCLHPHTTPFASHVPTQDYRGATEHYSAALRLLEDEAPAPGSAPLRLAVLTNRSLALHRLGRHAAAAEDAEAALRLDPTSTKAAFRAAAARLMAGEGAAAARHAQVLLCIGPAAHEGASASPPAAWAALAQHAAALAEHERRLAANQEHAAVQRVAELLAELEAEAAGEGETEGGPVELLQRLAALLGAGSKQEGNSCSTAHASSAGSNSGSDAEAAGAAAAALEAHPQGFRLLLFFLADPDPATQQAAAGALQATARAAGGGAPAVALWPSQLWQRLAALTADAGGGGVQAAALRLLRWAAERDSWVRQHLLLHPLPASSLGDAASKTASGSTATVAQVAGLLSDAGAVQRMSPAAVQAAAQLLRVYASDAAAAEGLAQLGCRPLLALLHAVTAAEGMPGFQPPEQAATADGGPDASLAGGSGGSASGAAPATVAASKEEAEQAALEALRSKLRNVFIPELVSLQRCLLSAAADLAGASRELLLAEVVQGQGGSGGGKRGVSAGPFLTGEPAGCGGDSGWRGAGGTFICDLKPLPITFCLLKTVDSIAWLQSCSTSRGSCMGASRGAPPLCWAPMAPPKPMPSAGATSTGSSASRQQAAMPEAAGCCPTQCNSRLLRCLAKEPASCPPAFRRFAADFKDNPAGDFLLSMDLQQGSSNGSTAGATLETAPGGGASHGAAQPGQAAQPPLLHLCLLLLLATARASASAEALLHRRDLLGFCEELCSYCTPAVVSTAQQIVAALADRVPAAAEELLQSPSAPALAALLLHSTSPGRQQQALDKLAALADTCSGDEFAALTGTTPGASGAEALDCAAYHAWQLASAGTEASAAKAAAGPATTAAVIADERRGLQRMARRFLLRCCERAQRAQRLGPQAPPRGGCWGVIGRAALQQLLRSEQANPAEQREEEGHQAAFSQLKRGFLAGKPPAVPKGKPAAAATARDDSDSAAAGGGKGDGEAGGGSSGSAGGQSHSYKQGTVLIEELGGKVEAACPAPAAPAAPAAPSRPPAAAQAPQEAGTGPAQGRAALAAAGTEVAHQQQEAAEEQEEEEVEQAEDGEQEGEEEGGEEEEEEVPDLQDVFDSSASLAAEQRRVRAEWLALPMSQKLRWGCCGGGAAGLVQGHLCVHGGRIRLWRCVGW